MITCTYCTDTAADIVCFVNVSFKLLLMNNYFIIVMQ